MPGKILVTGATGYVGGRMVPVLSSQRCNRRIVLVLGVQLRFIAFKGLLKAIAEAAGLQRLKGPLKTKALPLYRE